MQATSTGTAATNGDVDMEIDDAPAATGSSAKPDDEEEDDSEQQVPCHPRI